MDVIQRRAGRVLVIDDEGRVLMIRGCNPDKPDEFYWFTPGGGLEPDETTAEAAARELYEETGLRATPGDLVGPIYTEEIDLPFGGLQYRQTQDFYALRVPEWAVAPTALDQIELDTIDSFQWLSVDDLAALETKPETVYPPNMRQLMELLID